VGSYEIDLELAARRLEGLMIERVFYLYTWDAPASMGEDALFAVVLDFGDRCLEVCWADELGLHHGFHIALHDVTGPDPDRGRIVEVTDEWRKRDRLKRIARATIEWGDVRADLRTNFAIGVAIHADHLRRIDYPRALVLRIVGHDVAIETRFTNAITVTWR
jgi:hypothetical protein